MIHDTASYSLAVTERADRGCNSIRQDEIRGRHESGLSDVPSTTSPRICYLFLLGTDTFTPRLRWNLSVNHPAKMSEPLVKKRKLDAENTNTDNSYNSRAACEKTVSFSQLE